MEVLQKQQTTKGPSNMFTGDVWFDVIARGEEPSRHRKSTWGELVSDEEYERN
jgi:hypothetical protein